MSGPITISAVTHTGLVRRRNEDRAGVQCPETTVVLDVEGAVRTTRSEGPVLVVVTDGMGGHPDGALAARIALDVVFENIPVTRDDLVDAVHVANRSIYSAMDAVNRTMGTTLAAVLIDEDGEVTVVNVGDSPVYEFRGGELIERSVSDSVSPGDDPTGRQSGVVTQALGGGRSHSDIRPHVYEDRPSRGCRLLICSDGLSGFVAEEQIVDVLTQWRGADAVTALLDRTLLADAPDNVTIVLLEW